MNRLMALIVDDEPLARDRLRGLLAAEPMVEVIGECADGNEALAAIRVGRPDVVFLDIQIPGPDGLQVAARLPSGGRPVIVFTTAHEKFALEAFNVAAVDYLLKPFDRERLQEALRRVQEVLGRRPVPGAAPVVLPGPERPQERIAVKAEGRIVFLRAGEIVWVEANDNHVVLHLARSHLVVRETMAALEARLGPAGYARVSRSALVQLDQIKELQPALHGDYTVVLRDGTRLPLSRSHRGRLERFAPGVS